MSDETKLPPAEEPTSFASSPEVPAVESPEVPEASCAPDVGSPEKSAIESSEMPAVESCEKSTDDGEPVPAPKPTAAPPKPSPATLPDSTVIARFRDSDASAYTVLNRDFGLSLTAESFSYLQGYCKTVARRDPTLGELRVLNAIVRIPTVGNAAHRHAVGELVTDSEAIAETWADMMGKHACLSGTAEGGTVLPPCTFADALTLTTRYLSRTGRRAVHSASSRRGRGADPERLLLCSPAREMEALAGGYSLRAGVCLSDGRRVTVAARIGRGLTQTAPRKGEMILYAPAVSAGTLSDFMQAQYAMTTPDVKEVRVVTRRSILETAVDMTGGVDVHAEAVLPPAERSRAKKLPVGTLCALPEVTALRADVLLRTSVSRAAYIIADLGRRGVEAVALGQVIRHARVILRLQNTAPVWNAAVADLDMGLLADMQTVAAHTCRPTLAEGEPLTATEVAMACLPSGNPYESGITPTGRETVALTLSLGAVLLLREERLGISGAAATASLPGSGYPLALSAVRKAVEALRGALPAGSSPSEMNLNLSACLTVKSDGHSPAACDRLCEVLCGLYRAAAEEGLPIVEPDVCFASADLPCENAEVELTVLAWAPLGEGAQTVAPSPLSTPAETPSPAPVCIFPTLRRSMEGSLSALKRVFSRHTGAECILQPIVVDRVERPVAAPLPETPAEVSPGEEDGTAPGTTESQAAPATETEPKEAPATETCEVLNQASVEKLVARAGDHAIPIVSVSETDARLLLENAAFRAYLDARLQKGGTVVVLGDACRAFAAYGYLPGAPAELDGLAFTGCAEVSYHGVLAETAPARRLVRTELLCPQNPPPMHLLTLTLPDGRRVPDGFVGGEGLVLGLLHGMDTATLPLLLRPRFVPEPAAAPDEHIAP